MTVAQPVADLPRLAAAIQQRWADGEPPDAAAALIEHPELATDKPLVLELAYEEFCLRAEAGCPPDPRSFAARFPFADSVGRLLAVHSFLRRHPTLGGSDRPVTPLLPGEVVGDLRVRRRLGRGGFADVYLVDDTATGPRPLVLKVSARGADEARTLGPLSHPHLMPVWGAPRVGDHRAVLTPYLGQATGETLLHRAAEGEPRSAAWLLRVAAEHQPDDPRVASPPPFAVTAGMSYERAVVRIAAAAADAVRYLHAHGVAHRDLKPSNLLLGPTAFPYLLDFNLAVQGATGRAGGTIAYAAPEVLAAFTADTANAVDWCAADLFSFAVMTCELLLARHPYLPSGSPADATAVIALANTARPRVADTRLPVSAGVRRLLLRCLDADPVNRPTANELARGLAAADTLPRWPWVGAAVASVLLATGTGWAGVSLASHQPYPPPVVDPLPPAEPFARGCWHVRNGQPDLAVQPFTRAAEDDPTGHADECLAYCLTVTGSHKLSVERATRAVDAGWDTAALFANRAAALYHTGQMPAAVDDCNRALAIDQNCNPAKLTRALAQMTLDRRRGKPIGRNVLTDLEVSLGNRGGLTAAGWLLVAEAYLSVEKPTAADRARAVEAVRQAVRGGYDLKKLHASRSIVGPLKTHSKLELEAALREPVAPHSVVDHPQLVNPVE